MVSNNNAVNKTFNGDIVDIGLCTGMVTKLLYEKKDVLVITQLLNLW